jgi:hypothetical protein
MLSIVKIRAVLGVAVSDKETEVGNVGAIKLFVLIVVAVGSSLLSPLRLEMGPPGVSEAPLGESIELNALIMSLFMATSEEFISLSCLSIVASGDTSMAVPDPLCEEPTGALPASKEMSL